MSEAAHATAAAVVPVHDTVHQKGAGTRSASDASYLQQKSARVAPSSKDEPLTGIFKLINPSNLNEVRKQRLAGQLGASVASGSGTDAQSETEPPGSSPIGVPVSLSSIHSATAAAPEEADMSHNNIPIPSSPVAGKHGTGDYYNSIMSKLSRRGSGRASSVASASGALPPLAPSSSMQRRTEGAANGSAPANAVAPSRTYASSYSLPANAIGDGPDPNYKETWVTRVLNPPHMQSARRVRMYGPPSVGGTPRSAAGSASREGNELRRPSFMQRITNPPHMHNARSVRIDGTASSPGNSVAGGRKSSSFLRRLLEPRGLEQARSMRLARESTHTSAAPASTTLTAPSSDLPSPTKGSRGELALGGGSANALDAPVDIAAPEITPAPVAPKPISATYDDVSPREVVVPAEADFAVGEATGDDEQRVQPDAERRYDQSAAPYLKSEQLRSEIESERPSADMAPESEDDFMLPMPVKTV